MSKKFLGGLAVLACLTLAAPCRAGDATVVTVKVTKLMGNMYEVEFTGVLKLTDIGGGFEKWAAIDCKVSQTGTTITAGINSLSQPTLLADGSYIAKAQVFANPTDVNWTATATITWYKNAQMQIDTKDGTKAFTVP